MKNLKIVLFLLIGTLPPAHTPAKLKETNTLAKEFFVHTPPQLTLQKLKQICSLKYKQPPQIGLCIMATGRYVEYAERLIESAQKFFCKSCNVTYFVFTDGQMRSEPNVIQIYQDRLGWPQDTLMRFKVYANHAQMFRHLDYVFAIDADMLFVAPVGEELLSESVGTQHPGFVGKRGSYERRTHSTAYVQDHEGTIYFAGGIYGGSRDAFLKLVSYTSNCIDIDLQKNMIAIWHDESHLNRYFIDNPPSLVLSPSYCYPEELHLPYEKKILALCKNHDAMRK